MKTDKNKNQNQNQNKALRPVRVLGAEALGFVRGGVELAFTTKINKSSPG